MKVCLAAVFGSLLPDLSLYLLAGWAMLVQGLSAQTVFGQLYFSPSWQAVFAIDNSFILWGVLMSFALWAGRAALIAFAGAGCLHLVFDFLFHNDDARRHFWPVTDWVFHSPVSYWDPMHHGAVIGTLEIIGCLVLAVVLWRRFSGWRARAMIAALAALQSLPGIMWGIIFS